MTKAIKLTLVILVFLTTSNSIFADTFYSARSGTWDQDSTWVQAGYPTSNDDVVILDGHAVTITGSSYEHNAGLIIQTTAELIMDTGDSADGFIFDGTEFHVFGALTLTFSPEKDLLITGNSFFWGHDGAEILVSDDMKIAGNSTNIVDNVCINVDDDFHVIGSNTSLCGGGGVSIGTDSGSNTLNLLSGATMAQVCIGTTVYRGAGGTCTTVVNSGTLNNEPQAINDTTTTTINSAITIDVLNLGSSDNDLDSDSIFLSCGGMTSNGIDNSTDEGGTIAINDNGTPNDPTDDYIDYTPPTGFIGDDQFNYTILDEHGGIANAVVLIAVTAALPIQLVEFTGNANFCSIQLNWSTSEEINNDYIEVQRSSDAQNWSTLETIDGFGNSTAINYYQYTDEMPQKVNYYRLKQVDFDGAFDYSDVLKISPDCHQEVQNIGIVQLYPNPVSDQQVTLSINAIEAHTESIIVADLAGNFIYRVNMPLSVGINTVRMDVAHLPSGQYIIMAGKSTKSLVITQE